MNTTYNPAIHHRRSIRLRNYDYGQFGYYYVTICIHEKRHLLGEIVDSQMHLSEMGAIVELEWKRSEVIRNEIIIHDFVVMPNHLHGIVQINCDSVGAKGPSPVHDSQICMKPRSLSSLISGFKAAVTTQCRQSGHPEFAWHRGYHERIVRNVDELFQVRQYIRANPMEWAIAEENGMCCG